jgi:hypothetical protein
MGFLLSILGDEYLVAGSLLAALVPVLVMLWDTSRDETRIVRERRTPEGPPGG